MKEWISDDHGTITGRRLMKQDHLADQKEIYIHDGDEVIADDTQTGTNDPVLAQTYVNGPGIDSKAAVFEGGYDPTTAGGVNDHLRDHINSTSAILGHDGSVQNHYVSNARGQTLDRVTNPDNRYTFTGREEDIESGLMHYRNRAYHVGIGRFTQLDKLKHRRFSVQYKYTANNPLVFTDPLGLCEIYLTFDDGPTAGTDDVFDVLEEFNVDATFFFTGRQLDSGFSWSWRGQDSWTDEEIMEKFTESGHLIGSHSVTHARLDHWERGRYHEWYTEHTGTVMKEFEEMESRLSKMLSENYPGSSIARLPGRNTWRTKKRETTSSVHDRDSKEVADKLSEKGYEVYGWDIEYKREHHGNYDDLIRNIEKSCEEKSEVVILFHDRDFRESQGNKKYLREFIKILNRKGFQFKTIDRHTSRNNNEDDND